MSIASGHAMTSTPGKITRGHSCITCNQRKVKCDGKRPCSTCVKNSRATECRSARPAAGRMLDAHDQTLLLRLRRYEQLLIANGIPLNSQDGSTEQGQSVRDTVEIDDGHMITQKGHPRFVDSPIWNRLGSELADDLPDSLEADQTELSEDEASAAPEMLIVGQHSLDAVDQRILTVPRILRLWQVFLDNFNPLIKLFHVSQVQPVINDAIIGMQRLSPSSEALLFAISLCAVCSMTNEDCISQLDGSRSDLLTSFSHATQQALVKAEFLNSVDLTVLQAFTLFLLARRRYMNEQPLWLLSGLACRIAQVMGIHREHSLQQLSLFEAEIRRRLWWQIVILDGRSGQVSGAIFDGTGDTRWPLNVNDSDLSPFMREELVSSEGPTEMLFCTICFEIGKCLEQLKSGQKTGRAGHTASIAHMERCLDAFEAKIESIFKRCDPSIPIHLMSMFLGRSAACQMRLTVRQPKSSVDKEKTDILPGERNAVLRLALKIMEYDSLVFSTKSLQPFLWHVSQSFPFSAVIQVLSDLLHRPPGDELADSAWICVNRAYEYRPELITNVKSALYLALGKLTLKAWDRLLGVADAPAREAYLAKCPAIAKLQAQRQAQRQTQTPRSETDIDQAAGMMESGSGQLVDDNPFALLQGASSNNFGNIDINSLIVVDDVDMGWEHWQNLNFET